jgi:oligosaccharyl transferase complex subunit OST4
MLTSVSSLDQPPKAHPHSSVYKLVQSLSRTATMITDDELYRLAIFLGCAAMVLIVLYHFLEVNANEKPVVAVKEKTTSKAGPQTTTASTKPR